MAKQSPFKSYERGRRISSIETDFSSGMYFTDGAVNEGYMKTLVNLDLAADKVSLSARPGLRTSEICHSSFQFNPDHYSEIGIMKPSVEIFAAKDCIENGHNYRQIIFGDPEEGRLWVITVDKESITTINIAPEILVPLESTDINEILRISREFIENYQANTAEYEAAPTFEAFDMSFSDWANSEDDTDVTQRCTFNSVSLDKIHDLIVKEDAVHFEIVGTFGFNNSYYFIIPTNTQKILAKTYFSTEDNIYKIDILDSKSLTASEAVTYGYNMLAFNPYQFENHSGGSSIFEMMGILPYDEAGNLMMTPQKNQNIWFFLNYDIPNLTDKYKIVWEWKELTSDEWIQITEEEPNFSGLPDIKASFKPPSENIMVRVSAYKYDTTLGDYEDAVETAMTVGFDFTIDEHGTVNNLEQKNYDLKTASGLLYWKNRLVLYGVPEDPTVIFISDLNEPTYFPYPNNITVLDQPVVSILEFMGDLVAFTTDKVYQIKLSEDGNSWNADVIQTNLRINPLDRHLILPVRNMLFFKSDDYYYMIVPKSTSTTGELTLAPISTPMIEFFKNFHNNLKEIFEYVYACDEPFELLDYYNFLDYEEVHNVYVFNVEGYEGDVHIDVIYHTVDRTWRLYIYQTAHKIFPYQYEATHSGVFAITNVYESGEGVYDRCIQLLKFDSKNAKDFYIPIDYIQSVIDDPVDKLRELVFSDDELYTFKNYQYFDTGYRNDEIHTNKRYREVQLQINNIDLEELEFGLEFRIDGDNRLTFFHYDTEQVVDINNEHYGYVYIEPTPIMNVPIDHLNIIPDEIDFKMNHWKLSSSRFPEVNLWKVRVPVSGKGMAPRMKLLSCNESRLNFFSLNWVYRVMYMR